MSYVLNIFSLGIRLILPKCMSSHVTENTDAQHNSTQFNDIQHNDAQQNDTYSKNIALNTTKKYSECRYTAECHCA
jgi:hypothetical protein